MLSMFSKACEYGIKSVIYIAKQSLEGKRVKIGDVSQNTNSPAAFSAKVLGLLTRNKIVSSLKGPYGGFEIEIHRLKKIKLSDVVYAIDGDTVFKRCALGLDTCNDKHPCPLHHKFSKERDAIKRSLEKVTLFELASELRSGQTVLTRYSH